MIYVANCHHRVENAIEGMYIAEVQPIRVGECKSQSLTMRSKLVNSCRSELEPISLQWIWLSHSHLIIKPVQWGRYRHIIQTWEGRSSQWWWYPCYCCKSTTPQLIQEVERVQQGQEAKQEGSHQESHGTPYHRSCNPHSFWRPQYMGHLTGATHHLCHLLSTAPRQHRQCTLVLLPS